MKTPSHPNLANFLTIFGPGMVNEVLLCPVTHAMFRDPVFIPESGNTYERSVALLALAVAFMAVVVALPILIFISIYIYTFTTYTVYIMYVCILPKSSEFLVRRWFFSAPKHTQHAMSGCICLRVENRPGSLAFFVSGVLHTRASWMLHLLLCVPTQVMVGWVGVGYGMITFLGGSAHRHRRWRLEIAEGIDSSAAD